MDKYYTYKIYDPVLDMYYIGSRTRSGIKDVTKDNYMGSPQSKEWKPQWKEISKRSTKTILKVFNNPQEAINHEIELHNELDIVANPKYFNQAKATISGFSRAGSKLGEEQNRALQNAAKEYWNKPENKLRKSELMKKRLANGELKWTEEQKKAFSEKRKGAGNPMYGRKLTPEQCKAISERNTGRKMPPKTEEQKKRTSEVHKGVPKKRIDCDICGKNVTVNTLANHQRNASCFKFEEIKELVNKGYSYSQIIKELNVTERNIITVKGRLK